MAKLTDKQQAFVREYVFCLNATEAAARAGYRGNRNTLGVVGHENLNKPEIAKAIEGQLSGGRSQRRAEAAAGRRVKVYLIRAENGLVKIGKTIDVGRRFAGLNMMSPVDLELVRVFDTFFGDELEEELHALFDDKRVKGEWFRLSDRDVREIIRRYG